MSRLEGNADRTARGHITWRSIYKDGAQFSCPWSPFNVVSLKHEPIELRRQTSGAYLWDASLSFHSSSHPSTSSHSSTMEIQARQLLVSVFGILIAIGFANAALGETAPPVVVGLAKCSDCARRNMNAEAAFRGTRLCHDIALLKTVWPASECMTCLSFTFHQVFRWPSSARTARGPTRAQPWDR